MIVNNGNFRFSGRTGCQKPEFLFFMIPIAFTPRFIFYFLFFLGANCCISLRLSPEEVVFWTVIEVCSMDPVRAAFFAKTSVSGFLWLPESQT